MRGSGKSRVIGLAALAAVCLTQPAVAAEAICASPADVDAFVIRDLQSRLMIAGLACGQRNSYTAFVTAHKPALGGAGRRLINYFRATGNGTRALDTHVTRAANAASLRHSENRDAFCAETAQLFQELLGEAKRSLVQVARAATLRSVTKPMVCMAQSETIKASADADTLVVSESYVAAE